MLRAWNNSLKQPAILSFPLSSQTASPTCLSTTTRLQNGQGGSFLWEMRVGSEIVGTDSVDKNVMDLRPYLPIHASEFSEFVSTHSEFFLYAEVPGYGFGWLPYHLSRGPWSLRVYLKAPNRTLYLVTRTEGTLR